jgi:hypothetical protein
MARHARSRRPREDMLWGVFREHWTIGSRSWRPKAKRPWGSHRAGHSLVAQCYCRRKACNSTVPPQHDYSAVLSSGDHAVDGGHDATSAVAALALQGPQEGLVSQISRHVRNHSIT